MLTTVETAVSRTSTIRCGQPWKSLAICLRSCQSVWQVSWTVVPRVSERSGTPQAGNPAEEYSGKPDPEAFARGHALKTSHAFATTSPAFLRCVFLAFRILQLTTLYSGHMASESLTLLVMRLSIISGKWKVSPPRSAMATERCWG